MEIVTKPTLSPAFPVPSATRLFSTAPECECTQHTTGIHNTQQTSSKALSRHFVVIQSIFVALRCCRRVVALLSSFSSSSSSSVVLFPLSFPSPHSLSSPFSCHQCSTREQERKRESERGKMGVCACGGGVGPVVAAERKQERWNGKKRQQKSHI